MGKVQIQKALGKKCFSVGMGQAAQTVRRNPETIKQKRESSRYVKKSIKKIFVQQDKK